jgi:DNA repair protein RadD
MAEMVVSAAPQLRPYQSDALAELTAKAQAGHKHIVLQAATGSGKTHMACELIRRAVAKGKHVVFVAHRLAEHGIEAGIVMRGHPYSGGKVQVCSRDTVMSRTVRNQWRQPPPGDLVIVDECHNAKAPQYQRLLALYPDAYVVGLTATPARADGSGLGPYFTEMVEARKTSLLVADRYLVPVRCFAPPGRKRRRQLSGDPVSHWLRFADGRPTVLFTSKVSYSKALTERFNAAGVPAAHIDAHTPDGERQKVYDAVCAGAVQVVCNVGVWTEGTDLPQLSCCVLYRVSTSCVLYLQAAGRIMRPHPTKQDAVLLDHAGAVHQHGFPDEDFPWALEGEVDDRVRQAKKQGERKVPRLCPLCGCQFPAGVICPNCGLTLARKDLPPQARKEHLVEQRRKGATGRSKVDPAVYWRTCLWTMAAKRQTLRCAAGMFCNKIGKPPWQVPGLPDVPAVRWMWLRPVIEVFPNYRRKEHGHG